MIALNLYQRIQSITDIKRLRATNRMWGWVARVSALEGTKCVELVLLLLLRRSLLLATLLPRSSRNDVIKSKLLSFGYTQAILPLLCLEQLLAFVFFALLQILALLAALAPGIGLGANVVLYRWALSEVVYQSHDLIKDFDFGIFLDLYSTWVRISRLVNFCLQVVTYTRYFISDTLGKIARK